MDQEEEDAKAAASNAARALNVRRNELLGPEGRRAAAAHAGRASWKGKSRAEISLELRRRWMVARRRKRKARKAKVAAQE